MMICASFTDIVVLLPASSSLRATLSHLLVRVNLYSWDSFPPLGTRFGMGVCLKGRGREEDDFEAVVP